MLVEHGPVGVVAGELSRRPDHIRRELLGQPAQPPQPLVILDDAQQLAIHLWGLHGFASLTALTGWPAADRIRAPAHRRAPSRTPRGSSGSAASNEVRAWPWRWTCRGSGSSSTRRPRPPPSGPATP